MYGGFDWSGKPDKDKRLICGLAVTEDMESWSMQCAATRRDLRMRQHAEFHARDMNEQEIFVFLQAAYEAGIIFGALILEKAANPTVEQLAAFNYAPIAQELFRIFAERYEIKRLWYDTEIQGRAAEKAFETELCRINRTAHPGTQLKARSRSSDKSNLIQAADPMAYVLNRTARNAIRSKPLQNLVEEIVADKRNIIIGL